MSALLPVFLKLEGRKVLVVGGGAVAAGKLAGLLEAGADVTVVAPEVHTDIDASPARKLRRGFDEGDLDGASFVVAAATPDVNLRVARAAGERGLFVNAVDDREAATAYGGGVLRRGGVTIAVSTEGAAPALAGLLREALEQLIPEDIGTWVEEARSVREAQHAEAVAFSRRRPLLLQALNRLYEARAGAGAAR